MPDGIQLARVVVSSTPGRLAKRATSSRSALPTSGRCQFCWPRPDLTTEPFSVARTICHVTCRGPVARHRVSRTLYSWFFQAAKAGLGGEGAGVVGCSGVRSLSRPSVWAVLLFVRPPVRGGSSPPSPPRRRWRQVHLPAVLARYTCPGRRRRFLQQGGRRRAGVRCPARR